MSSVLDRPAPGGAAQRTRRRFLGVRRWDLRLALTAVLVRLPLVGAPARPDEAGYLLVAAAAHPHGRYLYGDLWVDRPPLLVAFFRVADALGGLTALRLLALLPVVLLVLAAASAGRTLAGDRGGRWAAVVAASLSVTPLLGAPEVDGELLAVPLVLLGCAVGLPALLAVPEGRRRTRRPVLAVAAAGALGACAVLVKQNFADALVLLAVVLVVRVARRDLPWREGCRLGAALVAGALVPVLLALAWAASWGWGPTGLWQPLFAFRSASLHVITVESTTAPARRATVLAAVAVASGLAVVLATFLATSGRHLRRADPATSAVTAAVLVATPSIALGGSFWIHYLLELVPAAALAAALLARRPVPVRRWTAVVLAVVVGSALVTTAVRTPAAHATVCGDDASRAAAVSEWLAARAQPGDTAVALYGGASTLLGSGTTPAYPYLWSLPVRTLDPQLDGVLSVVSGPQRATWVVQAMRLHAWGLDPEHRLDRALADGYQPAVSVCGLPIRLASGLSRPAAG